jgi:hypothetical protein
MLTAKGVQALHKEISFLAAALGCRRRKILMFKLIVRLDLFVFDRFHHAPERLYGGKDVA